MNALPMTAFRVKDTLHRMTFAAKVFFTAPPSTTVALTTTTTRAENRRQWVHAALIALLFFGLYFFLCTHAFASDGDEFKEAAGKFETWVKGNLGKLAAFVALGVGSVVAAVKKDWSWFFGAVVLAMGIGIIAGIVNASFTATI